eukprot:COSAG06_NODE_4128_length_4540_cov_14.432785_5_plen_74_part_00
MTQETTWNDPHSADKHKLKGHPTEAHAQAEASEATEDDGAGVASRGAAVARDVVEAAIEAAYHKATARGETTS